jgi:hypothetical protein
VTTLTSGGLTSGVSAPPGGLRRIGSARWRRRNLTFDKITFFLVFLVIPVAFYIAFVVSPFVQADRLDGLLTRDELHRAVQLREAVRR